MSSTAFSYMSAPPHKPVKKPTRRKSPRLTFPKNHRKKQNQSPKRAEEEEPPVNNNPSHSDPTEEIEEDEIEEERSNEQLEEKSKKSQDDDVPVPLPPNYPSIPRRFIPSFIGPYDSPSEEDEER